ncbi:hypothetical protein EX30DRAFT_302520 [Ascodesmis nigricans]|uniref:C2H2-type domain-containing protein n=1 Tax=Ascodesmis nigricans TaxID=341454 RepID=A0A4V3SJG2_9PEZI|nr:hypothetical protein EX30DRAFT_302520 [Ascodesmis nigricans]
MSTVSSPLSTYSSTATSSPSGSPPPTLKRAASVAFSSHPPSPSASDISSDTSGSVPGSPGLDAHDEEHAEQITVCRWDGCGRDLGDMDHLVKHIHDDHIGTRKATYACQWDDCTRKGMAHASGYALRAHMRSHTKEKPFYCSLPECDRSFTRSDALAKHMRTVHETEALRPSDPIPKSHPNHPLNHNITQSQSYDSDAAETHPSTYPDPFRPAGVRDPRDDELTAEEEAMDHQMLYTLLRKRLSWAEMEKEDLEVTLRGLERRRREAWIKKEMLLDQVLERELGKEEARKVTLDWEE